MTTEKSLFLHKQQDTLYFCVKRTVSNLECQKLLNILETELTEHLAKSHSLLLVAAYSMSADSHYQLFNFPSLSVQLLQQSNTIEDCRDLSKPLLLYNCKHITGECKLFPTPLLNRNSLILNETVPKLETLTWDGCKLLSRYSQGGQK